MHRLEFTFIRRPSLWQRVLAFVIAAAVLTLAFFLGLFVLIIILGLMIIAAAVVTVRRWRQRRTSPREDVFEGRYTVIRRERRSSRDRDQ